MPHNARQIYRVGEPCVPHARAKHGSCYDRGMSRRLEIALTLVLFAIVMSVASWVVNATVPGFVDWLYGRIGVYATLALIAFVIVAAGAYGIYDHRRAGTKPNGR